MLGPLTVDEEDIPVFRAALRAVADPLVAAAGDDGEIVFLDTKVFDQEYMRFCDNFVRSWLRYPKRAREQMRRRRAALAPHLGQPILHGGVSHAGFSFNLFVLKATGAVLCWASQAEWR